MGQPGAFDAQIGAPTSTAPTEHVTQLFESAYNPPGGRQPAERASEGESTRDQINRELDSFRGPADKPARNISTADLIHDLFPDQKDKTEADVLAKLRDPNTRQFRHCDENSCVIYRRQ